MAIKPINEQIIGGKMSDFRYGYWVYFISDDRYEPSYGLEFFKHAHEAQNYINKRPNWEYTIIHGSEKKIKPVTRITELEVLP